MEFRFSNDCTWLWRWDGGCRDFGSSDRRHGFLIIAVATSIVNYVQNKNIKMLILSVWGKSHWIESSSSGGYKNGGGDIRDRWKEPWGEKETLTTGALAGWPVWQGHIPFLHPQCTLFIYRVDDVAPFSFWLMPSRYLTGWLNSPTCVLQLRHLFFF